MAEKKQEKRGSTMHIQGKKITTIISDLDGTLLGDKKDLNPALLSVIGELERKGVSFVAASGRQYKNMRLMFEPLAKGLPFICENGSLVVKDDKTLYRRCIPRELAFELIADMMAVPGAEMIVSSDRELYALAYKEDFIRQMNAFLKPEVLTVADFGEVTGEINKVSIWWPQGIPQKEEAWFHEKYDGRLLATDSGNGWLDFTREGVNKGAALRELARMEGFSLDEALCFGDSENDIPMFRECALSFAMETSRPHVKAQADAVCGNVGDMLYGFLADAV